MARLAPDFRCITPTWPLGSHRIPMRKDADVSLLGLASLIGEFLDVLDLHDVTLVQNDWGGVQVLLANRPSDRVAAVVLTPCEAFDNYPPGVPGLGLKIARAVPGGITLLLRAFRFQALRRAPVDKLVRRDLLRYFDSVPPKATLLEWAEANRSFDRPVLIVWGTEDKVMPPEHGRRLAALYPDARLIELDDTYTIVPEDRPDALADAISKFVRADVQS